jgi:hypothetical protein
MNSPTPKKRRGVDEGFEFVYLRLSYRRKFIRTLWTFPFMFLVFVLPGLTQPLLWFLAMLFFGILQAGYNYWKWKSEDKE